MDEDFFYQLYQRLSDVNAEFNSQILEQVRQIALALSEGQDISLSAEERRIVRRWRDYFDNTKKWVDNEMPKAYKKALKNVDADFPDATPRAGSFVGAPLFGDVFTGEVSDAARQALKEYPNHLTMYGVFQESAYDDFAQTRMPIVRDVTDTVRELTILASDDAYRNADTLTRRELSQQITQRFANKGITGIRYKGGRTMNIDSYAEMVARTQTGNASRQAAINRTQEYGQDLILVSQHYPVSPLCEPYQGGVYSISGDSNVYPPFQDTNPGAELFHANCKHSISAYSQGQRIPEAREKVGARENERRYELQKQQRYNERSIRKWKRREQVALTDSERQFARGKVRAWQQRQRELLDGEDWMRRRYSRESI